MPPWVNTLIMAAGTVVGTLCTITLGRVLKALDRLDTLEADMKVIKAICQERHP